MKMIYSTLIFILLLATTVIPSQADVFPAEPFNGLQIVYSVSGATLQTPVDVPGYTWSRTVNGALAGNTLTVSGTAKASGGWGANIDVTVRADGQADKTFHQEKFPKDGLANDPMNQEFSVSIPIEPGTKMASFYIDIEGSYNAGLRGVTISGKFAGVSTGSTVLDTWNKAAVNNNAQCRSGFTISEPHVITYINTYHWNNGQGVKLPGAITLFNLDDGQSYGTWPAEGEPGMGGVPNAVWVVRPDIEIPAGRYEIADSDNPTWSNNEGSNNCGFSKVEGIEGTHSTVPPAPARTIVPSTPVQTQVIPTQVVPTQVQTVVPSAPIQKPSTQASTVVNIPNVGIIAVISMVFVVYMLRRKI